MPERKLSFRSLAGLLPAQSLRLPVRSSPHLSAPACASHLSAVPGQADADRCGLRQRLCRQESLRDSEKTVFVRALFKEKPGLFQQILTAPDSQGISSLIIMLKNCSSVAIFFLYNQQANTAFFGTRGYLWKDISPLLLSCRLQNLGNLIFW